VRLQVIGGEDGFERNRSRVKTKETSNGGLFPETEKKEPEVSVLRGAAGSRLRPDPHIKRGEKSESQGKIRREPLVAFGTEGHPGDQSVRGDRQEAR